MGEYYMNIKQFAEFLNIDNAQYNRYEKSIFNPPLEMAINISIKLKKTVNEIWYKKDE